MGIEGYSGTGKSTLLKKIAERNSDILAVHRDDFLIPRSSFVERIRCSENKEKTMEYESVDVIAIRNLAHAFRTDKTSYSCVLRGDQSAGNTSGEADIPFHFDCSKRIMLLEGVWLYHPKLFDDIFDYRVVLNTDQEAADERRRQREMTKWGDSYMPDTHPDSYFRLFKIAYNEYLEKYSPVEKADLIVNIE